MSKQGLNARVLARTGIPLSQIDRGQPEDLLGAHILLRVDTLYIIGVGYPIDEDGDGNPIFDKFRVVSLAGYRG